MKLFCMLIPRCPNSVPLHLACLANLKLLLRMFMGAPEGVLARPVPYIRRLALFCKLLYDCPIKASWRRRVQPQKGGPMKSCVSNLVRALGLVAIGVAIAVAGIYVGDTDDAPGAALIGILLMIAAVALAVRTARRKI